MSTLRIPIFRTLSSARVASRGLSHALKSSPVASSQRNNPSPYKDLRSLRPFSVWTKLFDVLNMGLGSSKDLSNSPEAKFVQETVNSNCVVIFSKTTCSYCSMAKRIFREMGVNYLAIEVNQVQGGDNLQGVLGAMTGEYTVPRVFVNGKCVGGGTEVRNLHTSGKLQALIQSCQLPDCSDSKTPSSSLKSEL